MYVESMQENAAAKKINNVSVEEKRRRGPRSASWVELIEMDVKELRIPL